MSVFVEGWGRIGIRPYGVAICTRSTSGFPTTQERWRCLTIAIRPRLTPVCVFMWPTALAGRTIPLRSDERPRGFGVARISSPSQIYFV